MPNNNPTPPKSRSELPGVLAVIALMAVVVGLGFWLQSRSLPAPELVKEEQPERAEKPKKPQVRRVPQEEFVDDESPRISYERHPEIVPYASRPCLALIIDDWGYDRPVAASFLDMGIPLTAAILPHLPKTEEYARRAKEAGFEVFVHLPMEPVGDYKEDATGMITTNMSGTEIRSQVQAAIAAVPGAVGINNHMGSKASADQRVMQIVLSQVREAGLIFVDSRTSSTSCAYDMAQSMGLAALANSNFIDGRADVSYIKDRLLLAARTAKRDGYAVAIGHVRPMTVRAITAALPEIERMGVQLVRISELFEKKAAADGYPWVSRATIREDGEAFLQAEHEEEEETRVPASTETSAPSPETAALEEVSAEDLAEQQSTRSVYNGDLGGASGADPAPSDE